jgi:hypothetical protein
MLETNDSSLFQRTVPILQALITFVCGYVKCNILYKAECLRLTIYASYLWETLNICVDLQFLNIQDWESTRKKSGEVTSTRSYEKTLKFPDKFSTGVTH